MAELGRDGSWPSAESPSGLPAQRLGADSQWQAPCHHTWLCRAAGLCAPSMLQDTLHFLGTGTACVQDVGVFCKSWELCHEEILPLWFVYMLACLHCHLLLFSRLSCAVIRGSIVTEAFVLVAVTVTAYRCHYKTLCSPGTRATFTFPRKHSTRRVRWDFV